MLNNKILLVIASCALLVFQSCSNDDDDNFNACTAQQETGIVTENSTTSVDIRTTIVIEASPEQVWSVLTDFENMPNWSSTFKGLTGDISDGGQITSSFFFQGQILGFPHALSYEEGVQFGWSDPISFAPGVVDNHFYRVEACGDETLFIQTDGFTGADINFGNLVDFANLALTDFQTFNQELKTEVEK